MILSIDIETYGAVKRFADGRPAPAQTVFHPARAIAQGIHPKDLIVTCSVTVCSSRLERPSNAVYAPTGPAPPVPPRVGIGDNYADLRIPGGNPPPIPEEPGQVSWLPFLGALVPEDTRVFQLHSPVHRQWLAAWLSRASLLLGMNMPFDVLWLRSQPDFRPYLTPDTPIVDLSVMNYLHSEIRPERSLKNIVSLFNIDRYDSEESLKHGNRYAHPGDPRLLSYNARDSHNTAAAISYLARRTQADHPRSDKGSDWCIRHYSDSVYLCTQLAEHGIPFSRRLLESLENSCLQRATDASRLALTQHNLPLDGPGSQKPQLEFMEMITREIDRLRPSQPSILSDKRVRFSDKRKQLGVTDLNREIFEMALPADHPLQAPLAAWDTAKSAQKLVSTYTYPLLRGARKPKPNKFNQPSILINDRAYPSWYPVPSQIKDGQGAEGGTEQGRMTCLCGGTRVVSSEGHLPIEEVVARRLDVLTYCRRTGTLRFQAPTHWLDAGAQEVFAVTVRGRGGEEVVLATKDHRWLTRKGDFLTTSQLRPLSRTVNRTSLRHVYLYTDHHGYPRVRVRGGPSGEFSATLHTLNSPPAEEVHHKDGNRNNFARSNLVGMTRGDHRKLHGSPRKVRISFHCQNCNAEVVMRPHPQHHKKFCSRKCCWEFRRNNYYVVDVQPAGIRNVYCFTVPQTETFVLSNGLVSGNCKQPAVQTLPAEVKDCIRPSSPDGVILWADLSQIELRVAALLSGEPSLLHAYATNSDLHTETAIDIFGRDELLRKYRLPSSLSPPETVSALKKVKEFNDLERQCGKHGNFTALNRGGAETLQRTILKKGHVAVPLSFCEAEVRTRQRRRPLLWDWQEQQLVTAKRDKILTLPICGVSRFFSGSDMVIEETFRSHVVNFPIQTWAGLLMRELQIRIMRRLHHYNIYRPRIRQIINIYDATALECRYRSDLPYALSVLSFCFNELSTPGGLWYLLQRHYGHTCPIAYDTKEITYGGPDC